MYNRPWYLDCSGFERIAFLFQALVSVSRQVVERKPRCRSIANFPGFEPSRDVHGIPVSTSVHQCPPVHRPMGSRTSSHHPIIRFLCGMFSVLSLSHLQLLHFHSLPSFADVDSSQGSAFWQELLWLAPTHERLCVPRPLSEHKETDVENCWNMLNSYLWNYGRDLFNARG